MSKIMIVEDDESLREIYGIRLTAEGYAVVSAHDGEDALAVAVRERPDLIISDVMMPKITGFDMLDILRSTPETQNIKVIMMTALSSEDQRQRGESLGADRYLVKSQVGIEDVVNVVHEVLGDRNPAGMITPDPAPINATPTATPNFVAPMSPVASPVTQSMETAPVAQAAPAATMNPAMTSGLTAQVGAVEPVATGSAAATQQISNTMPQTASPIMPTNATTTNAQPSTAAPVQTPRVDPAQVPSATPAQASSTNSTPLMNASAQASADAAANPGV